jgi:hypothetical protein
MEPTECSETPAFNIQTPEKYPEENISNPRKIDYKNDDDDYET